MRIQRDPCLAERPSNCWGSNRAAIHRAISHLDDRARLAGRGVDSKPASRLACGVQAHQMLAHAQHQTLAMPAHVNKGLTPQAQYDKTQKANKLVQTQHVISDLSPCKIYCVCFTTLRRVCLSYHCGKMDTEYDKPYSRPTTQPPARVNFTRPSHLPMAATNAHGNTPNDEPGDACE